MISMDNWAGISGQDVLIGHLKQAVKNGQLSHAYILEGEIGAPKRELASAFSRMLLCEKGTGCGECHSCLSFDHGSHPDVIWVTHEKPDTIRIDEIRDQLVDNMAIRPYSSNYKIYIIEEAEKMNAAAQNALLKTLEEPPYYGIIILITSNADKLLPTILSRCTRFLVNHVGRGLSEMSDEDKEDIFSVLRSVGKYDLTSISQAASSWKEKNLPAATVLYLIRIWFRDILIKKSVKSNPPLVLREESEYIRRAADKYSWKQCNDILLLADQTEKRIGSNVNYELAMELLLAAMRYTDSRESSAY